MKTIDLPWLDPEEPLSGAVDRLIQLNSVGKIAAVVTRIAGAPLIITAEAIIDAAREEPEKKLADVAPIGPSVEMAFHPSASDREVEDDLDAKGVEYGVDPSSNPMVTVMTRREPLADALGVQALICRCLGPRRHPWLAGRVPNNKKCFCTFSIKCP